MAINIWSRAKLLERLAADPPKTHNVICITESRSPCLDVVPLLAKDYLWLQFDDLEVPRPGLVAPEKKHVEQAVQWAADKTDLVIACYAGISRSSGMAYIIQCSRDLHPRIALNVLTPLKHHPNILVVKYGAEILKDEAVLDEYHKWMQSKVPYW